MNKSLVEPLSNYRREINHEEWYGALLEECGAVITEYSFVSRWARIEGYWKLGQAINDQTDNFTTAHLRGSQIVEKIANDIKISTRTVYYAIKFNKKYPDLNMLNAGKNITWNKIITEYLPESKREEPPAKPLQHKCPACGWNF